MELSMLWFLTLDATAQCYVTAIQSVILVFSYKILWQNSDRVTLAMWNVKITILTIKWQHLRNAAKQKHSYYAKLILIHI